MTDIAEIAVRTAIEIAFAYRNGETSPITLTEYLLERIEKAERDNIFITVTPARARKEAEAAEARYRRRRPLSVLDGVPIAWKDLFDVADACGVEEGSNMVGQSVIVAPSGEIVAMAVSLEDEVITARCELDLGMRYRETIFDFARHREPGAYKLIVERKGATPPPEI